ncbi:bifunctional UDP-3-O-[3-hydroxymyristoyl] N-acetylglucosamine deacetylase/3-hydroxyacyl-ACP dehydratase [Bacteroidota bacterium]
MTDKQKTLKKPAVLKGIGLHTGANVEIKINPSEVNSGIKFKRIDLEGQPVISATVDKVINTARGTTIKENGATVTTIEHCLAALAGLGIDNAIIELNGPELPILDGSAKYYVDSIVNAGIIELEAVRNYYEIRDKIIYSDKENDIEIVAYPDNDFSVNLLIDYNSKVLGNQYALFDSSISFKDDIAQCRTFVFFHELEPLLKNNLIKGGDLENAIVIMEQKVSQEELDRMAELFNKPKIGVRPEGIINNVQLYFPNEPARHKLLDFIGDVSLIGQPIKGRIVVKKPGHKANTDFARLILNRIKKERKNPSPPFYDPEVEPVCDIKRIQELLPHRPPFLLIDKIIKLDNERVVGVKNVTMNESFFVGHFPDEPVMPGVLQIEAMAQTGGILVLNQLPDPENYITLFLKIDSVKYRSKVVPGDTLLFDLYLKEPIRRGLVIMAGKAFVGNKVVMEGEMMAQIVKIKE